MNDGVSAAACMRRDLAAPTTLSSAPEHQCKKAAGRSVGSGRFSGYICELHTHQPVWDIGAEQQTLSAASATVRYASRPGGHA